jgi:hypothetical protein
MMEKFAKYYSALILLTVGLLFIAACTGANDNHATATTSVTPPPHQVLTVVPRPQSILDLMKQRGEQD